MAEEWVKNSRNEMALRDKDNAEAGLKTTKRQAEDLRKELHYCEINLATEK